MTKDYVGPISNSLSKSITADVYALAKKWFATLDPGETKLDDYRAGLLSSFGHIQVMGMPSPKKLESIYVGLRALPDLKIILHE